MALLYQSFEQPSHAVEVRDALLDEGELVFGQPACLSAVLPIFQQKKSPNLFQGEAQLLCAFDELQTCDSGGAIATHGAGWALRFRHQAQALVVPNGLLVDPCFLGDLTDGGKTRGSNKLDVDRRLTR